MKTKLKTLLLTILATMIISGVNASTINEDVVAEAVNNIAAKNSYINKSLLQRGASQVAALWHCRRFYGFHNRQFCNNS